MLLNNRVIWKNNATLTDLSVSLSDYNNPNSVIDYVALQDALYIGSDLPFNHRYIDVSVANDVASVASVEVWDGNSWEPVVDVIDQTAVGGKTLAQSGILSWTLERNTEWGLEESTETVTDLTTLKIYNLYWARLKFSVDLKATTALRYVGHKFSNDNNLYGKYADLSKSSMKTAIKVGKTDWDEQAILAAEDITRELRKRRKLWSPNQILEWEQFNEASIHKVAEIAYSNFGDDYEDNRQRARDYYDEAMSGPFTIDRNEDGRLEVQDKRASRGYFRV